MIGKVVDLHEGDSVFQAIKVMPDVDLIRLEEVSVLLGRPELEDELVH